MYGKSFNLNQFDDQTLEFKDAIQYNQKQFDDLLGNIGLEEQDEEEEQEQAEENQADSQYE